MYLVEVVLKYCWTNARGMRCIWNGRLGFSASAHSHISIRIWQRLLVKKMNNAEHRKFIRLDLSNETNKVTQLVKHVCHKNYSFCWATGAIAFHFAEFCPKDKWGATCRSRRVGEESSEWMRSRNNKMRCGNERCTYSYIATEKVQDTYIFCQKSTSPRDYFTRRNGNQVIFSSSGRPPGPAPAHQRTGARTGMPCARFNERFSNVSLTLNNCKIILLVRVLSRQYSRMSFLSLYEYVIRPTEKGGWKKSGPWCWIREKAFIWANAYNVFVWFTFRNNWRSSCCSSVPRQKETNKHRVVNNWQ